MYDNMCTEPLPDPPLSQRTFKPPLPSTPRGDHILQRPLKPAGNKNVLNQQVEFTSYDEYCTLTSLKDFLFFKFTSACKCAHRPEQEAWIIPERHSKNKYATYNMLE